MGIAQTLALLLVRLVVGITMIAHGYNHWRGGGRIAGTLATFWRPPPSQQADEAEQVQF